MFKKASYVLLLALIFIGGTYVSACENMSFDDADVCINIDKDGSNYELNTNIDTNTDVAITCHILLPDGEDRNISKNNCQWTFTYDDENTEKIKLYVIVNGEYDTLEEYYNFDRWERKDDYNNSNEDLDDFELDASDTTPNENKDIDITIKAIDRHNDTITNYDGKVRFKVEEKNGSYWDNASSSDYDLDTTYYNFDASDDGEVTLNDLLRITTNQGEFRLKVYDDDDHNIYEYIGFNMDGTSSNGDLDAFDFDVSDRTPDRNDKVNIAIEAQDTNNDIIDNYDNKVTLLFEIRDGYSRVEADDRDLEIDSNDFSDDENDLHNGELTVDFDNGELNFNVRFDENEEYRITVEDEDENIDNNQEFDVGGTSYSNQDIDDFKLDASDKTPAEDKRTDLEIEALNSDNDTIDYEGKVRFLVMRKDSDGDWITSSSAYYELDKNYYNFDSSDDGKIVLKDFIKFSREGEFKVKVYDNDDNSIFEYIEFNVGDNSNDNNNYYYDGFEITANPSHPIIGQRIDITIEATDQNNDRDRDYEGTLKLRVEKKSGTYRNIASTYNYSLDRSTINIDNNDNGKIEINRLLKFKEGGEYRIKIYDENHFTKYGYISFNIWSEDENNESDTAWFSNKEYDQIKAIYNIWPNIINQLKWDYYKLRYSNDWEKESDRFYEDMNDVLTDSSNRDFDNYDDFFDTFLDRYTLTIETR